MTAPPSFVVEDQSEVIDFLTKHLAPERRIDTHGAVVFLTRERGYKLKRAVKFPYMDFSTAERRGAMCAAEIEINHGWRRRSISAPRRCAAATASSRSARSVSTPMTPSTGWSSCAASTKRACSTAWPTAAR